MFSKIKGLNIKYLLGFAIVALLLFPQELLARSLVGVRTQVIYYQNYDVVPERAYYPIRSRRLPLRGANDQFYERDNIYGFGASAAGRMSHFTKNLPRDPRIYY